MDIRYCENWQEVMKMAIDYDGRILIAPVKEINDPDFSEVSFAKVSGLSIERLFELISNAGELIAIWVEASSSPTNPTLCSSCSSY